MGQVYFDHAATAPVRPEVVEAMLPYLHDIWGNPSSLHATGIRAAEGVERARLHAAALIGADAEEIVFTGSGTEADNHALIGGVFALRQKGEHVITSAIEHHAVLHTVDFLAETGCRVTVLPVDSTGTVSPDDVKAALTDRSVLVSIMHANNEVGTIQPIVEIGAICRERGVLFHTDAVQTTGHVPIDVDAMNVDLLSVSAHKFGGPKGVGALFIRAGVVLSSYMHGGGQEMGRRASTENVAGIVGMGEAARLAKRDMMSDGADAAELRDLLMQGALRGVPGIRITGHPTCRLPNNASFCIPGVEGRAIVRELDAAGFAVSSGSACTSGELNPSHVLLAMGIAPDDARGSLRVSVGRGSTREEVANLLEVLPGVVHRIRTSTSLADEQLARA